MLSTDRVYGPVAIEEPVLLELIDSPVLQRLKDIDQAGYFEPWFPGTAHSRFEHSVGVSLLLRRHHARLEEQIAGLIHDVSHSAFSHCIDYALDTGSERKQNHQDNIFDAFVRRSEIPEILQRHGFDPEYILDDRHFPLKERELPDLCADRIDYSLRTALLLGKIKNARSLLDHLQTDHGRWVFEDFESAERYAELFSTLNRTYYAGLPSAMMFRTVGDYLRHALSQGYLSEADLYTTDKHVLEKIKAHMTTDGHLRLLFDRMNNRVGCRDDPSSSRGRVFCKSRVVDPLCWHSGEIKRVSDVRPGWKKVIEEESRPKEYFLSFDR